MNYDPIKCPNITKIQKDKVRIFLENTENIYYYCLAYSKHKKGVRWNTMERDWKLMRAMYLAIGKPA